MLHQAPSKTKKNQQKFKSAAKLVWGISRKKINEIGKENIKLVILISGSPKSGKSSLAYYLGELFITNNIRAKHLWMDDFYIENYEMIDPASRDERRKNNNYQDIGPKEYNWKEIELILDAFKTGATCRMPCVDLLNQQIDWLETNFNNINVLILEGLYAIDMSINTLDVHYKFFIEGTGLNADLNDVKEKQPASVRQDIVKAENQALMRLKEKSINNSDLIVLSYDNQALLWQLNDFRQKTAA